MFKRSCQNTGALVLATVAFLASTLVTADQSSTAFTSVGEIKQYSAELANIIKPGARVEKLTDDKFQWAEGPAWVPGTNGNPGYLLADDVPKNIMYRWDEQDGLKVFLKPSGLEDADPDVFREPGANGLFVESPHSILSADSGNRRITRIDLISRKKTAVVSTYHGKKFNSPNDVIKSSTGIIYFTDPPYGLKDMDKSPARELKFSGVYRVATDGTVSVIDDSLPFPNGIALSPDEHTLYVSVSDPANPVWMAYTLNDKGVAIAKHEFANARDLAAQGLPGLPDGMKVANDGYIFAAAPGGILVMNPKGERLGLISTGTTAANCAFGDDGSSLYITSNNFLARVKLAIKAR
ncbi:MAG: SMP-30/gluconolactonase/LRE family protein [Steroidobacter sp.]